tara:strand:+ start:1087 stop:2835 length:1749 start_codon:yes stop_codon:yes gene_type:complete
MAGIRKIKWEYVILILIILLGFGVRYYGVHADYGFDGNDAPFFATFGLRVASLNNPIQTFAELMNFRWGAVTPVILALNLIILKVLNITITEKLITLPIVLIGTLTIFVIYLLGKELKNKYVGLMSALFLAILPLHVAQSRNIGGTWIISPFLLTLSVYLLVKYFYDKKYGFWASLVVSLYLISTSLFGGLIVLIPFIAILSSHSLFGGLKKIFKIKNFVLPALFLLVPVVSYIIFSYYGFKDFGFIGHIFHRGGGGIGFYIVTLFNDFVKDAGIYLVVLFIGAIVYGMFKLCGVVKEDKKFNKENGEKEKNKEIIPLIWVAIYTAPFLFLVKPEMTEISTYLNSMIIPLIILVGIFVYDVVEWLSDKNNMLYKYFKYCFVLVIVLILVLTSITMFGVVHRVSCNGDVNNYQMLQGSDYQNTGAKTAGYFVRENYKDVKIFTDLRPATGHYYLHMPVISSVDMDDTELFSYFGSISNDIDLVIVKQKNLVFIEPYLGGFSKVIEIQNNGKVVMTMFEKVYGDDNNYLSSAVLHTEHYDALFDEKYGNVNDLNYGLDEQIKGNKMLNSLMNKIKGGVFGFILN